MSVEDQTFKVLKHKTVSAVNEHNQPIQQYPLMNLLFRSGIQSVLPRIADILMDSALLLERETHIGAAPYQGGVERNGYANGFEPRTFQTGASALDLAVPSISDSETIFRISLLENGSRSDSTLKPAVVAMCVEGVSIRVGCSCPWRHATRLVDFGETNGKGSLEPRGRFREISYAKD